MGSIMKETFITMRNMDMEFINGSMVKSIMGNGEMENPTDKEITYLQMVYVKRVSGKMVKESDGYN